MANSLIKYHFKRALAALGYGECCEKVYWALGYCPGDGMAFEGSLYGGGLMRIIRRVCKPEIARYFERHVEDGLSFTVRHSGHYYHWNSMDVCLDWDSLRDIEGALSPRHFQLFEERAKELEAAIGEDVKDVSRQLETDGYALIEGTPCEEEVAREFKTARFTLQVIEARCEDIDLISGDEDYDWAEVQDIIHGHLRYFDLVVRVLDEDGEVIGEAGMPGFTVNPRKPSRSYHGELRGLMAEAIGEARENLPETDDEENQEAELQEAA